MASTKGWTGKRFADLIMQVAGMTNKENILATHQISMDEIEKKIDQVVKEMPVRESIGSIKSGQFGVGSPAAAKYEEQERLRQLVERKQRDLEREVREERKKAGQEERRKLATALRGLTVIDLDESQRNHLQNFIALTNAKSLENLILAVHFRRNFNGHHMTAVGDAEGWSRGWNNELTLQMVEHLQTPAAEREALTEKFRRGGKGKSAPATAPAPTEAMLKTMELARAAEVQKLAQEMKEKLAREEKHRRETEAAELEQIILLEQRDALGAGEW